MSTMYHGVRPTPKNPTAAFIARAGLCLTDCPNRAASYATNRGTVYAVQVDVSGAVEVETGDRDNMDYAGDDGVSDHEVIRFADEDLDGRQHETWRLMTVASLARIASVTAMDEEEEEEDAAE